MKLPDWFRSDYEWVWNGELLRFALVTFASAGAAIGLNALGADVDSKAVIIGPLAMAAVQTIHYIQGRLPARESLS